MPNCSNMLYKPQENLLGDDITCHVTILNLFFFAYILPILKATSMVNLQTKKIDMINRQAIFLFGFHMAEPYILCLEHYV